MIQWGFLGLNTFLGKIFEQKNFVFNSITLVLKAFDFLLRLNFKYYFMY